MHHLPLLLTALLLSLLSSVTGFAIVGGHDTTTTRMGLSRLSALKIPFLGDKKKEEQQPKSSKHPAGTMAKMTTVESLDDFNDFLKEDDRLCVVK